MAVATPGSESGGTLYCPIPWGRGRDRKEKPEGGEVWSPRQLLQQEQWGNIGWVGAQGLQVNHLFATYNPQATSCSALM